MLLEYDERKKILKKATEVVEIVRIIKRRLAMVGNWQYEGVGDFQIQKIKELLQQIETKNDYS